MKYAGAYTQDSSKSIYLEDIKLIMFPNSGPKEALWSIRFLKFEYKVVSWDLLSDMIWGSNYLVKLGDQG